MQRAGVVDSTNLSEPAYDEQDLLLMQDSGDTEMEYLQSIIAGDVLDDEDHDGAGLKSRLTTTTAPTTVRSDRMGHEQENDEDASNTVCFVISSFLTGFCTRA